MKQVITAITQLCLCLMIVVGSVAADERQTKDSGNQTRALLNGKNLDGWKPEGGALWEVRDGILIGKQGPGQSPGDLLTVDSFENFELKVTFRIKWPANSGVWYRYQSANKAFQADILEYKNPLAWTGSLYCTGKMFIAINEDERVVNRDGWNTMVIRVSGDRHIITLNGKQVADVRDSTSERGRIGFQIHAGDQYSEMRLYVKEVSIRQL